MDLTGLKIKLSNYQLMISQSNVNIFQITLYTESEWKELFLSFYFRALLSDL